MADGISQQTSNQHDQYHIKIVRLLKSSRVLCLGTFVEDPMSASRLSLLCSSGDLQGLRLQRRHIEKGRPFLLMRINGRSVCCLAGFDG